MLAYPGGLGNVHKTRVVVVIVIWLLCGRQYELAYGTDKKFTTPMESCSFLGLGFGQSRKIIPFPQGEMALKRNGTQPLKIFPFPFP